MLKSPLTSVLKVTYVVIGISDESIELFSLHNEGVITRLDNTAFRCYGTSSVDVVTSDHANRDTSSLALFYGVWYLGSDRVLDSNHTDAGHVVNNLLFLVPVWHTKQSPVRWKARHLEPLEETVTTEQDFEECEPALLTYLIT